MLISFWHDLQSLNCSVGQGYATLSLTNQHAIRPRSSVQVGLGFFYTGLIEITWIINYKVRSLCLYPLPSEEMQRAATPQYVINPSKRRSPLGVRSLACLDTPKKRENNSAL